MAALLKKRALAEYAHSQEPHTKKLNLIKKPLIGSSAAVFIGMLDKCKTSNDALQLLLRISDCLQFQESDIEEAIKKLSEHFQSEEGSAVRMKILWMFCDIGLDCPGADVNHLLDETVTLLKEERSHKVIAQGVTTMLKLGAKLQNDDLHLRLIAEAKFYLKDTSHRVKCQCLQLISELFPVSLEKSAEAENVMKLIADYTYSQDARVRSQAFEAMLVMDKRGLSLDPQLYDRVCPALADDYEIVRQVALKLVHLFGNKYPENTITLTDGETTLRLVDDAFVRICGAVNDLSMVTRALACSLLGGMQKVSQKFLQQTLDKKLMSNMRRKLTAHERGAQLLASGEWADGRRWGADNPRERLHEATIAPLSLMAGGAAGAFVHGLEDEFLEVRSAAVESVCELALHNPTFAITSLDFLVDMFNDEIEDVRLKAIDSLTKISSHIVLREDQLETILGALEDFSMDVREGLHRMLASSTLASKVCLEMCVDKILENLKKYPQDKKSTYRCLQKIGAAHPELTLPLVPQLLCIHPFFDMPQPDVDDPSYICVLILVLNAAQHCSAMLQLFEEHTIKHYSYLRDTMPHLVPQLRIGDSLMSEAASFPSENNNCTKGLTDEIATNTRNLLDTIMSNVDNAGTSTKVRTTILSAAQNQLNRLAEIDPAVSGGANFTALYLGCELLLCSVLSNRIWNNPTTLASPQGLIIKNNISTLMTNCLKLQNLFVGCTNEDISSVKQLTLRALVLQLVYIVRGSNQSALAPCHALLLEIEEIDRFLVEFGSELDQFTLSVFQQLATLPEPKPGPVARCLLPLLNSVPPSQTPRPNPKILMCTACILEPLGESETPIKFTAGLIAAIPLEAEVMHIRDPSTLRVRVKYPDQVVQISVPRTNHLRKLDIIDNENPEAGSNLRLITKVLISHQVWTEESPIEISLCLAVPKQIGMGKKEVVLIDLCKPVKVNVSPIAIKRGI